MSERFGRIGFLLLAGAMLLALVWALSWRPHSKRVGDAKALAAWIETHPADGDAANDLTEAALDSDIAKRVELWRAAHEHAKSLDPRRSIARIAFVRSAFFHWSELAESDRQMVLSEVAPLLHDPPTFRSLAPAIWRLTHNFAFLRGAAGKDYSSIAMLRDIAATNGRFDDYKALRDDATRARLAAFASRNRESDPIDFVRDCTTEDQPLIEAILTDLHDHPIDKRPATPQSAERLIDYAIRHGVGPLDGLEFLGRDSGGIATPLRARLAIALGDVKRANLIETGAGIDNSPIWADYYAERAAYERAHGEATLAASYSQRAAVSRKPLTDWSGNCGADICTSAHKRITIEQPHAYAITLARVAGDEVDPYAEVYVDDARFGEGAIASEQTFTTPPLLPGDHRIDVRLVNPFTRNLAQRRAKVLRESIL